MVFRPSINGKVETLTRGDVIEMAENDAPSCFVITPIGDRNAEIGSEERSRYEEAIQILEKVIQPACAAVDLKPVRADRIARAGEIPEQVFRHLRDAEIAIADVTGGNPNVMYELGLRHSRNLLTIQIGQVGRLPFYLSVIRTIQFIRTESGLIDLRNQLEEILKAGLRGDFDSVTATRLWHETEPQPPDAITQAEDEEPGFLEHLATMEEQLPELNVTMTDIGAVAEEVTGLMQTVTDEVNSSDLAGGGASQRLAIAIRFASALDEHSERLETLADKYENQMRAVDPGVTYILSELEAHPDQVMEAKEFIVSVSALGPLLSGFVNTVEEDAAIVAGMAQIARPLRKPSGRMAGAMHRIGAASLTPQKWAERAARLV